MRRNKDNKRVLRSGNGRQQSSKKRKFRRNKRNTSQHAPMGPPMNRRYNKKRKTNKSLVLIMIIALIAFVIGVGIGVSLSFDDDGGSADNAPHFKNVTKEMTSNLNDTKEVYYDKTADAIDFNENNTSEYVSDN